MKEKLQAYQSLLEVALKNKEHIDEYDIQLLQGKVLTAELEVNFGITLPESASHGWCELYGYVGDVAIGLFGKEYHRTISWSDDGCQPENEWLLKIGFCTGAYIFGDYLNDCYPKETFEQFFSELKGFEPKYCDSANKALYFTAENAKIVLAALNPLYQKYKALVKDEMERKRIKELEKELAKLKEKSV